MGCYDQHYNKFELHQTSIFNYRSDVAVTSLLVVIELVFSNEMQFLSDGSQISWVP
jgi:hypothetical protein